MPLKISPAKWRSFYLGLNVLRTNTVSIFTQFVVVMSRDSSWYLWSLFEGLLYWHWTIELMPVNLPWRLFYKTLSARRIYIESPGILNNHVYLVHPVLAGRIPHLDFKKTYIGSTMTKFAFIRGKKMPYLKNSYRHKFVKRYDNLSHSACEQP